MSINSTSNGRFPYVPPADNSLQGNSPAQQKNLPLPKAQSSNKDVFTPQPPLKKRKRESLNSIGGSPEPLSIAVASERSIDSKDTLPKNAISVGKAAKYGALIGTGETLLGIGLKFLSEANRNKVSGKVLLGLPLVMAVESAGGALSGAFLGYFLKRSQNPAQPQKPTSASVQQTPPKNAISVGKAAKYGAWIGAGQSLSTIGFLLLPTQRHQLLVKFGTKGLFGIPPLIMAMKSATGALWGAFLGYFLKRSQKQE